METFAGHVPLWITLSFLGSMIFFGYPFVLLSSIALKWIMVGRYKAGRYPLWSLYYFRVWFAARAQAASGIALLAGTPIMSLYYRLMGARVGKNCTIDTSEAILFDMITIGDHTTIGSETQLQGFRVEQGMLVVGETKIGSRCVIGTHCYLGINSVMEDDTILEDMSLLSDHQRLHRESVWSGSPAKQVGKHAPLKSLPTPSRRKRLGFATLHLLAFETVQLLIFLPALPFLALLAYAFFFLDSVEMLGLSILATSVFFPLVYGLWVALLKGVILRRVNPGRFDLHSFFYLRKWSVDVMLSVSRQVLHGVYTTIYLPSWLRLLGAKIGKHVEISNVSQLYPDLVEMESGSFFADGSLIGGRRFEGSHMILGANKIGARSFVGNNARLGRFDSLDKNSLLGVMSRLDLKNSQPPAGTEWLGSPAFHLPHRVKSDRFGEAQTYRPTKGLIIQRLCIDGLRIIIPNLMGLCALVGYLYFLVYAFENLSMAQTFLYSPLVSVILFAAVLLSVPLLKWILMGRFHPTIKPLWSTYVFVNEMLNGIYETVAVPLLSMFEGTPMFNIYLRLMGCRIGKHCYIGTSLFSEFDLVDIGNYVALNSGVVVQNHLFEDRIMKSSYQKIEDGTSVGNMSVLLYDSVVGEHSIISPLSLVMKGERLSPQKTWTGIPVAQDNSLPRRKEQKDDAHG